MEGENMTELEIRAFLTALQSGSITSAAGKLYVTQPALSKRIQALENELGYRLIRRGKGQRTIELTDKGEAFVPVAERYLELWKEAREIDRIDQAGILRVSAVNSVSTYLFPTVCSCFMSEYPEYLLNFSNYHSLEAYGHVAEGRIDLALISDDMEVKGVETVPLFEEDMLLALGPGTRYAQAVHPSQLNVSDEIRLPWSPEYDMWHDLHFKSFRSARMVLDQMSLMEYFLGFRDIWAVVPATAALKLREKLGIEIRSLEEGPPAQIIYYLKRKTDRNGAAEKFLAVMERELERIEKTGRHVRRAAKRQQKSIRE